jgi:hypothetical protein
MCKTALIAALLAAAIVNTALAVEVVPTRRTTAPAITFDEMLKKIADEITFCKRLHGTMTKIASVTMRGTTLDIVGEASLNPIDKYPMKVTPTKDQLKSLKGQPICDPN